MEKEFQYYAFISYKREDEKWAKWLQGKLENYKLPTIIRKEIPRLPKKIRPVFLDKTDLGAGFLENNLQNELSLSQYLIVISSPKSATSEWVGKEIEAFIQLGRKGNIVPFIVEGYPNSTIPENECFHPVIKAIQPELLGISVPELGKEQAYVKVVSRILGLKFDMLWNRHQRRTNRKKILLGIISLMLFIGFGVIWDYNRTKIKYYADFVEYADGWLPKGVGQLTLDEVSHREENYCFEYKKGKLRKVVHTNSKGVPIDHNDTEQTNRVAIYVFNYPFNESSTPSILLQNCKSVTLIEETFGGKNYDRIDLKSSNHGKSSAGLVANVTSITANLFGDYDNSSKAEIKRYALTRNKQGFVIRKEFKKYNGEDKIKASDAEGIYGFDYKLDSLGRPVEISFLDFNLEPTKNKSGVFKKKYFFDKCNNLEQTEYYGSNGSLTLNEQLWAVWKGKFDRFGNNIEGEFFGLNNLPIINKFGWHRETDQFDKNGNRILRKHFGIDNKPCTDIDGVSVYSFKYDELGNNTEVSCFDVNNKPCFHKLGYSIGKTAFNDLGLPYQESWYDTIGNPSYNLDGFHLGRLEYDANNQIVSIAYYDSELKPTITKGYSKIRYLRDEEGHIIELSNFGIEGKLYVSEEGYAKAVMKYNESGNRSEIYYYGIDGTPCYNKEDGVAKISYKYDEYGNIIEEGYFDEGGNPMLNKNKYASAKYKYDENGNNTEGLFLGTNGTPCLTIDSISKAKYVYNERGFLIKKSSFGVKDEPCINKEGYSTSVRKFNRRGDITEDAYYGCDGKPCFCNDGYAKLLINYDDKGNQLEMSAYDINEKLISSKAGYARACYVYDDKGNIIKTFYYGMDNKPSACVDGYAAFTTKYDGRGNKTEQAYLDANGYPCLTSEGLAKYIAKFDAWGNIIEKTYFGIDGKPCKIGAGYAKYVAKYNEYGKQIVASFFDIYGKPTLFKEGYSYVENRYTQDGRVAEIAFFDIEHKPCLGPELYAKMTTDFFREVTDSLITVNNYYGIDGKLKLNIYGYARFKSSFIKYKSYYIYETCHYDVEGNPTNNEHGYSSMIASGTYNGNIQVSGRYFDTKGKILSGNVLYGTIVKDGAAYKKGMRDNIIILRYCNWSIGDPCVKIYDVIKENRTNTNKELVILDDKQRVMKYYFNDEKMGIVMNISELVNGDFIISAEDLFRKSFNN